MSRPVAALLAICLLTFANACAEPSAPVAPPADSTPAPGSIAAASIVAVSPVKLTATVGTAVATPPSVLVKDVNGAPMVGAVVNFSITDGSGAISNSAAITNSSGVASVSTWEIGTSAGLNVVTADIPPLPSIRFEVTGVAGPAADMIKLAGDNQAAARGSSVPIPPQVKVTDGYNNPVTGITVTFSIESGGGSVVGENATADSLGIATLGSWTLGAKGGQILVANVAELTPVEFRATTFDLPEQCTPVDVLSEQTVVSSELGLQGGCQGADGRFVDYYVVRTASAGSWNFKISSADFDTRLELRSAIGMPIASDRPSSLTTSSEIRAILPAGTLLLTVTSTAAEAIGRYDISYRGDIPDAAGCEFSIVRGGSSAKSFMERKCPQIAGLNVDRYRIYLKAGSTVSIVLEDHSLSDNHMEIQDDAGKALAQAVYRNYVVSTLDYTASADGYYVISIEVAESYDLFVQ